MEEYLQVNRDSWNRRVDAHFNSDFYDVESFLKGRNALKSIELDLLGDVQDQSLLHLMCHFGMDTLSLQRMGANCTGIDISDKALEKARLLNDKLGLQAKFVESDLYSVPQKVKGQYDIVFTSYGTIGWIPDLDKWASVIRLKLRKGGRFIMADFHPVVWMMSEDFEEIKYSYFNVEPIIETYEGTYADKQSKQEYTEYGWNHPLSEILQSLIDAGLTITKFQEFDYSPEPCFEGIKKVGEKQYIIEKHGRRLPMTYAIEAFV